MSYRLRVGNWIAMFCVALAEELMFNLLGGQTVVAGLVPVVSPYLPLVGFVIAVGTVIFIFRQWNTKKGEAIRRDLADIERSAEEILRSRVSRKTPTQFHYLIKKYNKWFPLNMKIDDYAQRAAAFSEIIRIHGYIKGRKIIREELRRWSDSNQDNS